MNKRDLGTLKFREFIGLEVVVDVEENRAVIERMNVAKAESTHPATGIATLRPRARIIRTLGDELISSEIVAIAELVKNAYDADATRAQIRFQGPLEVGKGRIEVIDNGHGMTLETIRSTWMEPATLMRKREPRSRGRGRRVLGEKGIGRFAASRLANFLEVVTRGLETEKEIRVFLDWEQFDDESKYLDQMEILWEEEVPTEIRPSGLKDQLCRFKSEWEDERFSHGTVLRMEGLRAEWNATKFQDLRNSLSRLVSPFFGETLSRRIDRFEISLDLPGRLSQLSGIVDSPELLRDPHYFLKGSMNDEGEVDVNLQLRGKNVEVPTYKVLGTNSERPKCGPIEIEFRVWDRDSSSLSELLKKHSLNKVSEVREELNAVTGISIYRDGFRVLPYGERDNDWLRLDLRRVQNPTLRLSNNQILGYVIISSDENPTLRDQSNREGLIEGRPLEDLRYFVLDLLSRLEAHRYPHRRLTKKSQRLTKEGLFADFQLSEIRRYVSQRFPDEPNLLTMVGDAEKKLDIRAQSLQEVLSRYRRLATLGQLIDIVLHDARAPLTKIGNEAILGQRDIERTDSGHSDPLVKLAGRLEAILKQSDVMSSIFRRIEPFGGRKRGRPTSIRLEDLIAHSCSVLDTEISEVGLELELPITNTEVTVDQAEIQQVIINLLQNSLYWIRKAPVESRHLVVHVFRKRPEEVEVIFSDSGPGIPPEFRERIFEPYFSTKPDGVGLGLSIAGEIITDYYGGVLELLEVGPLKGASFRFTLNRRV